jgi:serine protease Do
LSQHSRVALVLALVPAALASAQPVADLGSVSDSLRSVVERVGPSVVEVATTGFAPPSGAGEGVLSRRRGTGSGVILTPDGYIVTNAHVVEGARRIQVVLPRSTGGEVGSILRARGDVVGAQLVGSDLETDLAVLKVEGSGLPAVELADSDELRQGELVLAFGSPLGLEQSVTMGIVSSVARQLTPEAPMIYIQTDATINPGNSGGALVDSRGRLVGINTMIFSQSGGSEGIGFAAPSNIVSAVFDQIRATGRVRRGEIGVRTQTLTPILAAALGLERQSGVLVRDLIQGSPAEVAGMQIGDVILSLDGKPMENARQFHVNVYRRALGTGVPLEVDRGGRSLRFVPLVGERPGDPANILQLVSPAGNLVPRLGILALDIDERVRALLPRLRARSGVVVAAGAADAPFWRDPLQPGDVIYTLNGESVASVSALRRLLDAQPRVAIVALQVERAGELRFIAVELLAPVP